MFQALVCNQEQQVGIDTSKKNLIVSIPTLRWRERIDQNRDGIVLFCRCAVRARIDVVELVSLVPYQIFHHNVCLAYNLLYTSYFTQLTLSCPWYNRHRPLAVVKELHSVPSLVWIDLIWFDMLPCDEVRLAVALCSAWITSTFIRLSAALRGEFFNWALKSLCVWFSFELINAMDWCCIVCSLQ